MNRNLWLLALCQGLFLTNNVTFIAINGLVGLALAPAPWMATLPIAGYVVGGALATPLVARSQARLGRKRSFQIGLVVAAIAAALCAAAAIAGSFALLVAATMIAGYYYANAQLYRFAAAELSEPSFKERAISFVIAGGIVGAFAGPSLASATRDALGVPFAGAYAALAAVALVALALLSLIRFPEHELPAQGAASGRKLREIARQPVFVVAVLASAVAYGVMNLLMAATPIAMQHHAHPFSDAALVLEWHVLGMFVPGFFTGHLIKRFGVLAVMGSGAALMLACVAVALTGIDLMQFLVALILLGIGWNFLFVGATTMFTETYRPEEKNRAQGAMDFCNFATMALTSFASGALVVTSGWTWLNLGSLLPLAIVAAALLWLGARRGRAAAPQAAS